MSLSFASRSVAERLGIVRILFFSYFLLDVNFRLLHSYSKISIDLVCEHTMGAWVNLDLAPGHIHWLAILVAVSAALCLVGLFTRVSYLVIFVSFFLLDLNSQRFCHSNHVFLPVHLSLLFWLLLDNCSAYRLDNLVFFRFGKVTESDQDAEFLIRCQRVLFAIVFFAAGYAKLSLAGSDWFLTPTLQYTLSLQNYFNSDSPAARTFSEVNYWVLGLPWLTKVFALGALVLELSAPLALVWSRSRMWIVSGLLLMQLGIYVVMYVDFTIWFLLYLFWLPLLRTEPTFRLSFGRLWTGLRRMRRQSFD